MNVSVVLLRHLLYVVIPMYVQYFDYRFITICDIVIKFVIDLMDVGMVLLKSLYKVILILLMRRLTHKRAMWIHWR